MGVDDHQLDPAQPTSSQGTEELRPERIGLGRPTDGSWPRVWIDATYVEVREGGRIVSVAE
jgi:hypothetical protein